MRARRARHRRRNLIAAIAVAVVAVLVPALALAHIERASYWPDPAPDTSVKPAAGGSVPAVRKLFSALKKKEPGKTRVVCAEGAEQEAAQARHRQAALEEQVDEGAEQGPEGRRETNGYKLRPSQPAIRISKKKAKKLRRLQHQAAAACKYKSIQEAVTASHNNDRVEIMPGLYTEPKSRAKPTNDPPARSYKDHQRQGPGGRRARTRYQCTVPERPEPDRGDGPRARPNPPPAAAAAGPPRHPRHRAVHPLQPADPGHRRLAPTTS